ncbi:hypothetical protein CRUP_019669, partial [Coryphaenoides rupestris]
EGTHLRRSLSWPKASSPGPPRLPNGKLQCDICGMICIGPNVLMVHKRSHTRPFQCSQCGASFTQKGNLLRHIKLHSGEKAPSTSPCCSMPAVQGRTDRPRLAAHTLWAVSSPKAGKTLKCDHCGRIYKQQNTLEEHMEQCLELQATPATGAAQGTTWFNCGEDSPDPEPMTEKLPLVERLVNNITKRKRSTPRSEKHMRLDMPEAPYELSSGSEKEGDPPNLQPAGVAMGLQGTSSKYLQDSWVKSETYDAPKLLPHPGLLSDIPTAVSSLYGRVASQSSCGRGGTGMAGASVARAGEGRREPRSARSTNISPDNQPDSTDTESTAEEQNTGAAAPTSTSNHRNLQHLRSPLPPAPARPGQARDSDLDRERARPGRLSAVKKSPGSPPSSREALQVVDREGGAMRCFHCPHCRMLFLDHVMFTIHMGCHGFGQPFDCNICGHRSRDRYEFSSHISRGEHQLG